MSHLFATFCRFCGRSADPADPEFLTFFIKISVVRHKFSRLVGCWLDYASELSAHDAVRQRPPEGASARS